MRSARDVLYNFHWVVPGEAARAAQAWAGGLGPFLAHHGIASMINLRGPNPRYGWWRNEKRVCQERGIAHIDATLDSRHLPTRALLVDLIDAFDAARKPFLVKCSGGQDRTSLAAALYLLHRNGWTAMAQAHTQFARWPYLHLPKTEQRWLRQFVDFAEEDAKGAPLADWLRNGYEPERFRDWLVARGHGRSFKAIFETRSPAHWRQW
ncbi:MAG TPA: hypothetical protein VJ476_15650 [Rhizomicrobium sp.]|nr:hypothetical protein [Rhizomicrobium sp.]